jgi:23S rRNA (cytosine1962-C5)-methyltransferase
MAILVLHPRQGHRCLTGHAWVFRSECTIPAGLEDGAVVDVADHRGRFIGRGWYSASSQIAVRLLTRNDEAIDDAFLLRRLSAALDYRQRVWDRPCRRLVASEADLMPGLIVDAYHDRLVVQATTVGCDRRLDLILELLRSLLHPSQIVERNDLAVRRLEGLPERSGVRCGPPETTLTARLGSATSAIDLADPHKTGAYLDQQASHLAVGTWIPRENARVLDLCCHLGGFAIHALLAGAASAIAVDSSSAAIAGTRRSAELSGVADRLTAVDADAFTWLRAASTAAQLPTSQFDLILLDPPAFARSKAAVAGARRGYKELHVRALRLLAPGGVLASWTCSHHVGPDDFMSIILAAAADTGRTLRLERTVGAAPDHPVLPAVPETRYLTGFVLSALD